MGAGRKPRCLSAPPPVLWKADLEKAHKPGPVPRGHLPGNWGTEGVQLGGGFEERLLQRLRKVDGDETPGGIPVVLATFVHDPNVSVLCCLWVGNHAVDLASLEGGFIALVLDTNCKANTGTSLSSSHH